MSIPDPKFKLGEIVNHRFFGFEPIKILGMGWSDLNSMWAYIINANGLCGLRWLKANHTNVSFLEEIKTVINTYGTDENYLSKLDNLTNKPDSSNSSDNENAGLNLL
jgi:hypothetical protein